MKLADRLDRLRGTTPRPTQTAIAEGLRHSGRRPTAPRTDGQHDADLRAALQAAGDDGLLVVDRQVDLPSPMPVPGDLPESRRLAAADWIYIDTETTGLSGGVGNLAFMVGLARADGAGALQVRQLLISRFDAEASMLRAMNDWLNARSLLVSYNGRCFDVPLLLARLRLLRVEDRLSSCAQLDLMFTVRRAFRRHWPDCRLQTAERRLLGLTRVDDLPGAEAPGAWRAWLQRGDPAPLAGVLAHNRQDVISLALLHCRLAGLYAGGERPGVDHAAIGRAWRDAGDEQRARQVWRRAGTRLCESGSLQLAASYRRGGDWQAAVSLWSRLFARGSRAAACELSKYYEHRRRDPRQALRFAAHCEPEERVPRIARLQRKLGDSAQLPLCYAESAGESDQVAGTVGGRQAACEQACTTRGEQAAT